jgi:transitional endoplasmic reticulum ATPase
MSGTEPDPKSTKPATTAPPSSPTASGGAGATTPRPASPPLSSVLGKTIPLTPRSAPPPAAASAGTPSGSTSAPSTSPAPTAFGSESSMTAPDPSPAANAIVGPVTDVTPVRPAPASWDANAPPPSSPSRARPPAGGGSPLTRTFWAFVIGGIILLAVGSGLAVAFYPDIAHATNASQFLVNSGAEESSANPTLEVVKLTSPSVSAGQTVILRDTVASATYNSSSGTTLLTFQSINSQPSQTRLALASLAQNLFGTIEGQVSWIGSGTQIVMTFTVVQATIPASGSSGAQSYLTLDAAADATQAALASGASGSAAVAIGAQYFQHYPAVLYDGLFYFLIAVGAALALIGFLFHQRIEKWFKAQTKDPKNLVVGLMGVVMLFGGFFMPFYPWPYVLVFAAFVMGLAWKFPQLSLMLCLLLVVPEVAYQSGALGLIFIFAVIPLLFASLLDWRFGVGTVLTLFLAPVGLSFAVPIFFGLIFSLYLGLAVAVAGGILISIFVTLGNLPILGYLVGPGGTASRTLVSGHTAALLPTLPMEFFTFNNIGQAYGNLLNPNFSVLTSGGSGIGLIAIPLLQVGAWCLAVWLVTRALRDKEHQTPSALTSSSALGGLSIAGATAAAVLAFNYSPGLWMLVILLFVPAAIAASTGSLILRDEFEAYFTSRLGGTSVGTRVAEMKGLQKTTFEMVGGLHDVKADIKESLAIPLMRKDVTTRFRLEPPKGLLLFGPPGCGKTMLMKALASELGVEMISIKASDIMSKWYGESENKIADLLRTARERAPCILFMDEIDAVAKRRDMYTADDVTPRLLSILLSEMDGIDKSVGVIIVGSTNKPDLIDPALMRPGRLDKIIYVPPPDFSERAEILEVHLANRPVSDDINFHELAKRTERFSGADLANVVREAATIAVRRDLDPGTADPAGGGSMIHMDDFMVVLPRIKPSISLRMITEYETMKLDYERKMHQSVRSERKAVVRWDDVGGLEDTKQAIREYVELPLTQPELMESYKIKTGRAILLFGPPGCGKTHIMRAAASELNVPMQIVNGPELVSALAGQSEAAVRDVLYRARENAPSIVFFDEIDALAGKESMRTPEVSRAVSQFLTEMDGLRPKDKVMIIATTNRPLTLDPALLRPGRFDKIFYVPPPDLAARKDIFRIHLKGVPTDGPIDVDELARLSDGWSGADIANAVDEAKLIAIRLRLGRLDPYVAPVGTAPKEQAPPAENGGIRQADLVEAVKRAKTSITPEVLAWAQDFIKTYGTRG